MLFVTLQSAFLISVLTLKITTAELPTCFPKCYLNDTELNDCILNGFKGIKPYVGSGMQEIGLPSLKPLYVRNLEIGQNGALANYTLILNDFTVWGLDNYDVKEFRYDLNTFTFHGQLKYDKIMMSSAPMDVLGRVLHLPLKGIGFGQAVIGPIHGTFEVAGELKKKDGIDYYNPINVNVQLNIVDGSYFVSNLFDDLSITRSTIETINLNSKMFTNAVTPVFEELAKLGVRSIMESLTAAMSYNQMFP